jgi:uncharacterized membrane protein YdfJ with MMPL/SSD domain
MLLVPAAMHLLGRANWWLPAPLERALPQLHVEGQLVEGQWDAVDAALPMSTVDGRR